MSGPKTEPRGTLYFHVPYSEKVLSIQTNNCLSER